jgi:plasmid stabilization system protein ParE
VRYSVLWSPDAEQELARIWNNATDRDRIAAAADLLDRELSHNPHRLGESRPTGLRIAHCLPLGIRFTLLEEDQIVRVIAVWECRRIQK